MVLYDNIDSKIKRAKSKKQEFKRVDEIRKKIEKENNLIRENIEALGQYFWDMYKKGKYVPGEEKYYFDEIEASNERIEQYIIQIDDCKVEGMRERENIDKEYREKQEKRAKEAEEKRLKKEEEKELRTRFDEEN